MTTLFAFLRLPILLLLTVNVISFSSLFAQIDPQNEVNTEGVASDKKAKNKQKEVSVAEKNANDLRKINVLLAIAQDRDRQAGEAVEDIRSRRMRIEEDVAEADDNPKDLSKKERADLDAQLKSLLKKEKLAQKARETANSFLRDVTQAVASEPTKRSKFISTYERKFGPITDDKAIDTLSDNAETKETDKTQAVAVSEKTNTIDNTPTLSEPIKDENSEEKTTSSMSKKKQTSQTKKNESPKKGSKKKNNKTTTPESTTTDEAFPVVFNENANTPPTPVETVEPIVEQPKETPKASKKEPKKTSKKKGKKGETTAETLPKAEDFPVVLPENAVIVPTATPTTEPISDNSATPLPAQETMPNNDEATEENDSKPKKNAKKNDKKPKKNTSKEAAQGSLVSYKTYDRNLDVFMKSPAPECAIAYEGKDEFTGKNKRETAPARFFAHTEEMMRKGLQDKDFITCDLTGTKVESSRYTYLNMTFTILSKDIQRSLGFLDRGTPIIFVLVNGKKITMRTNKTDIGVVDIDKGITIYKAQLTAESITDLTESELDYVRVNWSSGYEDYEVYDVDILKNLFNCLYKK